jgi:hypothetical protein
MRNITPIVDRVELKFGRTTRGGALDLAALGTVTRHELVEMVATVREVRPDIPIGLFLLVAVGDDPAVEQMAGLLGDNLLGQFVGDPGRVVANVRGLDTLGISRVQLTEFIPGSLEKLAAELWTRCPQRAPGSVPTSPTSSPWPRRSTATPSASTPAISTSTARSSQTKSRSTSPPTTAATAAPRR